MQRAGFIGLGEMGAPMAERIVSAGFDLSVFDVRPESTDPLVELGATRAGLPREAAEGAEALVLMVVNAEQAEDAMFGGEGAAGTPPRARARAGGRRARAGRSRLVRRRWRSRDPAAGIRRCSHEYDRTRGASPDRR